MRWFESSRPSSVTGAPFGDRLPRVLDAFARGDLEEAAGYFSAEAEYREAGAEAVRGREEIAAHFARYAAAGPAWRFEVDEVVRDGDRACVVYRFLVAGGAGEPWRERAGCATVHLDRDGLIAAWREYRG